MTDLDRLRAALADRYALERELGAGGMATVYLAEDLKHHRKVAIKVLRPELAHALGAERFLREIRFAAQLQSPHILPLLDSGQVSVESRSEDREARSATDPSLLASRFSPLLYYVMPYVAGESLGDLLARDGALPPSETMRLLREIVDGLAHAHRHGVIHRDIKPGNVMLAERHAMLMDFGVAKALPEWQRPEPLEEAKGPSTTLTALGVSLGTPAYMAPEQAAADPHVGHRADIYAVGVMAYEMLTGAPPFTGTPQAVMASHITTPPPPLPTTVPPAIAAIVMKCLAKQPDDRYQTADELLQAVESLTTPSGGVTGSPTTPATRRRRTLIITAGVAAVALFGFFGIRKAQRGRWLRETVIPQMTRMIDDTRMDSAWGLWRQAVAVAPHDTALAALLARATYTRAIITRPAGAVVYRAPLSDTSAWVRLGITPLDSIAIPRQFGLLRYEKPGYRPLYVLSWSFNSGPPPVMLDSIGAPDPEMISIAGHEGYGTFLVGTEGSPELALGDWKMDRYETSNRDYKAFVDAGGYRDSTWWDQPFKDGGRTLTRAEAMARFIDLNGRPGPATWVAGDYPSGEGDMPVGGVSWYEAAAYAKWKGKSLPTIYHWAEAASVYTSTGVVPSSNLDGTGPWKVGMPRAVSERGISDMAGNVREWVFNEDSRGLRYDLGGGWTNPTYDFVDAYAQSPMDRSAINGIRLARYNPADSNVALAMRPINRAFTDWFKVPSVSDAVFAEYQRQFDYDPLPLDAKVEKTDSTSEDYNAQYVSFSAAYGGERMAAWILTPKHGTPPYQTVVGFPGSGAIKNRRAATPGDNFGSYVTRSGRAFVLPIYKSTFDRADSLMNNRPNGTIFWRDHVVMWGKDFRRTLDYLSTRPDIDTTRFAYFGYSWGGSMGGVICAVEPRIKVAVLYLAGLAMQRSRPETDPINYLPHIHQPVIMLNGKYDFYFPTGTAQRPFFERLGTAAADKKWVVYEGGHDVPRPRLIAETLGWLDKYLGVVDR